MQIEAGKKYVGSDGKTYGPIVNVGISTWPFETERGYDDDGLCWRPDGGNDHSRADLIAEYVEPAADFNSAPGGPHPPVMPIRHADDAYASAALDALAEVRRAKSLWPGNANSAHEQFAVLDEECDELLDATGVERLSVLMAARGRLWAHVKVNQKRRDLPAMRKEAIQVAAMALRFAAECCDEETGRK